MAPSKYIKTFLYVYILAASGHFAHADSGGQGSGGGVGIQCNKNGIVTTETLDLYNGREIYGLIPKFHPSNADEAADAFTAILLTQWGSSNDPKDTTFAGVPTKIKAAAKPIFLEQSNLDGGNSGLMKFMNVPLEPTLDAFQALDDQNCKYVQIGQIDPSNTRLLINKNLWEKMDWTNKVALAVHESLYVEYRKKGLQNSTKVQRLVAMLMAKQPMINIMANWSSKKEDAVICSVFTGDTDVRLEIGQVRLSYGTRPDNDGQKETGMILEYMATHSVLLDEVFDTWSVVDKDYQGPTASAKADLQNIIDAVKFSLNGAPQKSDFRPFGWSYQGTMREELYGDVAEVKIQMDNQKLVDAIIGKMTVLPNGALQAKEYELGNCFLNLQNTH